MVKLISKQDTIINLNLNAKMYKVFVNIPNGEKQVFELEENENVNCLKNRICESGLKFDDISLVHGGKMLEGEDVIMSENADVDCNVALRGKDSVTEKFTSFCPSLDPTN